MMTSGEVILALAFLCIASLVGVAAREVYKINPLVGWVCALLGGLSVTIFILTTLGPEVPA